MSYIVNIKNSDNREFNNGVAYVGDTLFKFDGSDEDKINLLKISRAYSKTLLGYNVPINYSTKNDESYTDGKNIVISSHIEIESLDSTIGLVLHESSHIAITNFDTWYSTPKELESRGIDKKYTSVAFNLLNWIEDRRIDNWAYNQAPGYVKYYEALYYRYFSGEKSDKVILELKKRKIKKTLNNYMFFIINFINDNVKRDELPDLDVIYDLIDIDNIDRFNDTLDCQKIAIDVLEIILKNLESEEGEDEGEGDGSSSSKENGDSSSSKASNGDGNGNGDSSEKNLEEIIEGMSDEDLDELVEEILKNHENLSNNKPIEGDNIQSLPERLSQKLEEKLNGLDIDDLLQSNDAQSNKQTCNENTYDIPLKKSAYSSDSVEVTVIDRINGNYIKNINGMIFRGHKNSNALNGYIKGKRLGKLLGKKLKLREEVRETKIMRQKKGKLDSRTIYTGGYTKNEMFYYSHISKHDKTNIHFSVDASGSMGGSTWEETISLLSAMAFGFTMVSNVRLQISFRTEGYGYGLKSDGKVVYLFYDSDIDKKEKLDLLPYVSSNGGTPEGLCYKALNKKVLLPLLNKNTLFINLSDGVPSHNAIEPTRESIKMYESLGMEVLSFLISESKSIHDDKYGVFKTFTYMYGEKNSFNIKTNEINKIANIINKKLLNIKK